MKKGRKGRRIFAILKLDLEKSNPNVKKMKPKMRG
jgi:hypothetical protein